MKVLLISVWMVAVSAIAIKDTYIGISKGPKPPSVLDMAFRARLKSQAEANTAQYGQGSSDPAGPATADPRIAESGGQQYLEAHSVRENNFNRERDLQRDWQAKQTDAENQEATTENGLWHYLEQEQDERVAADQAAVSGFEAVTETVQNEIDREEKELASLKALEEKTSQQLSRVQSAAG